MYDRIIVPVDEKDGDETLVLARGLARRLGAGLTLLHVHDLQEAPTELEGLTQYRYQHVVEAWDGRDMREEVHEMEWLARRAADLALEERGVPVTSRVVHAPLPRALHGEGERVMVVAPVRAEGPGPAVREIIRAGAVPVLLARPGAHTALSGIEHVFVALDGSRFSEEVLGPALELAAAVDARVSLVEVVTRHHGLSRLLHAGARSAEAAEAFLRDVRDRIGARPRPVTVRVVEAASPAAALVAEASREPGGLLALATHGRGGLRRLLLGSVAERVIREGAVPVLVLRPTGVGATGPQPASTVA